MKKLATLALITAGVSAIAVAPSIAQVGIDDTGITIGGKGVVATPTCANNKVPKFQTGTGTWVCGTDETGGGGDNTGLCTLYSLTGQTADAGLGCPAQIKKKVFVTSTNSDGNLGGLAGANATCTARKNAAGLTGTFKAWLAGSAASSAPDQSFTKAAATTWYILPGGQIVAIGWNDLVDGNIARNLSQNEFGTLVTTAPFAVWTNVALDGTRLDAISHCNNWTDNSVVVVKYSTYCSQASQPAEVGFRGSFSTTTQSWTQGGAACCDDTNGGFPPNINLEGRLFCFEQ